MAEPNENIVHVEGIENLAAAIAEHIAALVDDNTSQYNAKYDALEYLGLFSRKQIKALRDQYE